MIAIAIDGPAGSGKSTVAAEVAGRLHICHLDSGAMYRAVAFGALSRGLKMEEDDRAFQAFVEGMQMELVFGEDGSQSIFLDGENVTPFLREPAATMGAAQVAQVSYVRDKLVALQRAFARKNNVVMDGRDIGTAVLPDTPYKFYLTAQVAERARRRFAQKPDKPLSEIEKDIERRDFEDENRAVSPLRKAKDAICIDTTEISQEEVVEKIIQRIPNDIL